MLRLCMCVAKTLFYVTVMLKMCHKNQIQFNLNDKKHVLYIADILRVC